MAEDDKHKDALLKTLLRIEKKIEAFGKKPPGFFERVEKLTPFLATVVLAGVSTWLTHSLARQTAAETALRSQHDLELNRLERIAELRTSLKSPDVQERRVALALLASLGDPKTTGRIAAALGDHELFNSVLLFAARTGDVELVNTALQVGARLETDENGRTPLMLAAERNHVAVVNRLLSAGAETETIIGDRWETALMMAIRAGASDSVRALIAAGAEVNASYRDGLVPFLYLFPVDDRLFRDLRARHTPFRKDIAVQLIKAGVRLDEIKVHGHSVLEWAARNFDAGCIAALLDLGCNPNASSSAYGYTMLHDACRFDESIVELLLKRGAKVNARTKDGETPLMSIVHTATFAGPERKGDHQFWAERSVARIPLLLKYGAELEAVDQDGATPLLHAATGYPSCVTELIKHGANVHARNNKGETAVTIAIERLRFASATALIRAGADMNPISSDGTPALVLAVGNAAPRLLRAWAEGNTDRDMEAEIHELITLMIEKGADIEKGDTYGWRPLMEAASEGDVWSAQILLSHGAKPDALAKDGRSARSIARDENHAALLALFERTTQPVGQTKD